MKFFFVLLGFFGLIASANAQHEAEGKEAHVPHGYLCYLQLFLEIDLRYERKPAEILESNSGRI